MILCEKCGRVIQSYEVKYRLEVNGRRRTLCNEDAKEVLKALEGPAPAKAAAPAASKAPAPASAAAPAPGAPASSPAGAAAAAKPAPPKITPEELEARKKAALEKAAALKAQKAGEAPKV